MSQRKNIAFTMILVGVFIPLLRLMLIDTPIKYAFEHRNNIVLVESTYVCVNGMEPAELDFSLLLSDRCHGFSGRYEGGMEISYKSIVVLGAMLVFAGTMMLIWYKDPDPDQHVEAH